MSLRNPASADELRSLREQLREAVLDAENLGRKLGEAEAEVERLRAALEQIGAQVPVDIGLDDYITEALNRRDIARAALQPTPRAADSPQADTAFALCPNCGTPMNFHQDECEPQADTEAREP